MLTTAKYIEQLEKQNRMLALSLCEKYGDGNVSKGLEIVKEKYSKRPFDGAFGDLKVIIDIMESVSCDYKDIPPPHRHHHVERLNHIFSFKEFKYTY